MSMESSLDPQLIEQTKKQIRELVTEITQLSRSDVAPAEFYSGFLTRVITALAANGGAIWTLADGSRLTLQSQVNLQETNLREDEKALKQHTKLLQRVLESKEGELVMPNSSSVDIAEGEAGNPTQFLLVLGPLATDLETVGVVEIFQRPDSPPHTQKGYLRFVMQMCEIAVEYVKNKQLRSFSDRQLLWNQLEEFTRLIHTSLDPKQTAYTIANEGRRLIECDRLGVAIQYGKKSKIVAISGQDVLDNRSNTVRLLNKLATAVTAVEEPMWYMGDTTNFAPQVEDALQEYVDESHSKMVAVLPLMKTIPEDEIPDDPKLRDKPPAPIGALIVELIENSRPSEQMRQRTDVVVKHAVEAMSNSLEHERLFLMPLWRFIGNMSWVVKARTLPKTILVLLALLAAIIAVCVIPADFDIEATGTLEPVDRREVYAEIDGEVDQVYVHHGEKVVGPTQQKDASGKVTVVPGTRLAKMRNINLQISQVETRGKIEAILQNIQSKQRTLQEERALTVSDKNRIQGEILELKKELLSQQTQLRHQLEMLRDLDVCAVCDGVITTWDVQRNLVGRPVQRGQILMSIAQPDGPWQLSLDMPERRIGQIVKAQQRLAKDSPDAKGLPVKYILASNPSVQLQGTLDEVHLTAEVRGQDGATINMKVKINKEDIENPNIGATVTANVYCGRRPIGYVWLHDAIAFFYSKIWFRWF